MIHSVFNQLFVKILIQLHLLRLSQKSNLVSGNRPSEKILLLTCSHSRMCIRIDIFNFKKQTSKKKKKKAKQSNNTKKAKETKEKKRISAENRLKEINLRPPVRKFFS